MLVLPDVDPAWMWIRPFSVQGSDTFPLVTIRPEAGNSQSGFLHSEFAPAFAPLIPVWAAPAIVALNVQLVVCRDN